MKKDNDKNKGNDEIIADDKAENGKLILAFDEKYITPAKIDEKIINWDLLEERTSEIEGYLNIVFSHIYYHLKRLRL